MDENELSNRFRFHPAQTAQRESDHDAIRSSFDEMAAIVNKRVPDGREKSLAITNLEQAMMWANAGIARAGGK